MDQTSGETQNTHLSSRQHTMHMQYLFTHYEQLTYNLHDNTLSSI
jgi:hypothetical protein